ncbi:MAG: ABC transporter permease [Myxococcales bacterium]|nr:ABC transporter permease [Myxococcales bacterium]
MSPPPLPSPLASIGAVVRLQLRQSARGKRLRLGVGATLLVLLTVVAGRYLGEGSDPSVVMKQGLTWGFFRLLDFLLPFLLTSGVIAEEVESRTFTYLAARPIGRGSLVLGKYLASTGMSVALIAAAILLMHFACFATQPGAMIEELPSTLRAIGATTELILLYGAICLFWGALVPEAAGIASTLYLGIIEFCFSFAPGVLRWISMSHHAQELSGLERGGIEFIAETVPDVSAMVSALTIGLLCLFFLALAVITVQLSEFRFGKA